MKQEKKLACKHGLFRGPESSRVTVWAVGMSFTPKSLKNKVVKLEYVAYILLVGRICCILESNSRIHRYFGIPYQIYISREKKNYSWHYLICKRQYGDIILVTQILFIYLYYFPNRYETGMCWWILPLLEK